MVSDSLVYSFPDFGAEVALASSGKLQIVPSSSILWMNFCRIFFKRLVEFTGKLSRLRIFFPEGFKLEFQFLFFF